MKFKIREIEITYFHHAVEKTEGSRGERIGDGRIGVVFVTVEIAFLQWLKTKRLG